MPANKKLYFAGASARKRSFFMEVQNMKKAKRLLAVLLAALMIFCSASVSSYAYLSEKEDWNTAIVTNSEKYYFSYDQGATWVLDMLDDLLNDAQIVLTCEELNEIANVGVNIFTSNILLNLDDFLADAGSYDENGKEAIDLRSVDGLIKSLTGVFDCLESGGLARIAKFLGLLGDLIDEENGLQRTGLNGSILRYNGTSKDTAVLEMLVLWITNLKPMLQSVLAGTFDFGSLLKSLLGDMLGDLLPVEIKWGSQAGVDNAINTQALIRDLLYTLLVDSSATAAPEGSTLDSWVQQLIDWALVTGTGTDAASGATSMLGVNAEPLMPALANQPGGASIGAQTITVDRDKDGVMETTTMSFYQLVNNVINALMGGMLYDIVYDLLVDLLEIEITEQFPMGDPAILQDEMFALILGAVEGLLTANGAPSLTYTSDEMNFPAPRLRKLVNWLLVGDPANGTFPALDSFIRIDYSGIHITDNFMSLLNDVARLLINLLPNLGLFSSSAHLSYTPDQLNESWYLDANGNIVSSLSDAKVTQTYITYETKEIVYPVDFVVDADGVSTPVAYCYLDDNSAVNLIDANGNGDVNGDLIRPNYVITTNMVFANIIKLAFNDMVDGCYFPEWTTDIPAVLAYGVAAIAAPIVPKNNYYERLDAYYELTSSGSLSTSITLADGEVIEALPYSTMKRIPIKDISGNVAEHRDVEVPSAALEILCSFAAARLNGVFHFRNDAHKFTTDTSLEQFACDFFIWALDQYMPAFIGEWNASTKKFESVIVDVDGTAGSATYTATGIFADTLTTTVNAVYSDFAKRTIKETANWDVVYELIDNSLFKLLPSSWLPNLNGSAQLFNEWLFGNLIKFDIQGILGLLSVNPDPSAELNRSVTQVLINIIDRVLALVFNDNAILAPSGRTDVVMGNNTTTYTSLNDIIDCSSTDRGLPGLIWNLLDFLNKYKNPLLSTILPLVVSSSYSRPYEAGYLTANGKTEASYDIADLEDYLAVIYDDINATPVKVYSSKNDGEGTPRAEDNAEAATDGRATAMKNEDGVRTDVVLSNGTIFGTYATLNEAKAIIDELKQSYYKTECDDETLPEEERTYTYTVYFTDNYLNSAKNVDPKTDEAGRAYNEYSGFSYAHLTSRTASDPFVSYDDDYRFFAYEDFGDAGFYYNNEKDARDAAESFIGEYNGFIDELGNAYGAWYMFYVESQLKTRGLLDTNGDGRYLTADVTEGEVTYYADGDPSVPDNTMYPYLNAGDARTFTNFDVDAAKNAHNLAAGLKDGFVSKLTGKAVTGYNVASFTEANFEQLRMAVEAGNDPEQNVTLSVEETEKIIRLILGTLDFDITLNADGAYNGSLQWNTLTPDHYNAITTWLAANGFTYEEYIIEDGNELTNGTTGYLLKRPKFKFITDGSMSFTNGTYSHAASPNLSASDIATRARKGMTSSDTYEDEMIIAIHNGYYAYITALYDNRTQLLNEIDECSWRLENAEAGRSLKAETTMIKWVLDLTADSYMGERGRNYGFQYDEEGNQVYNEDGTPAVVKMYTTASYEKFRNAYDFAEDVYTASKGGILASGITQSMLTQAYEGVLKAWQQLVEFTGFADWVQIDAFVAMAEAILSDPYIDDPHFGVKSGLTELRTALTDALVYTDFDGSLYDTAPNSRQNYDSENQSEIGLAAASLNKAIEGLVYHSNPTLSQNPESDNIVTILPTVYKNQIQESHIYGLKEGVGFGANTLTAQEVIDSLGLKLTGMAVGGNNTISRSNSSRGSGTDARIDGRYENSLRFRCFAVLYGDINGDTRIDGTDVAAITMYINNNEATSALMGQAKFEAADVTHNGSVDWNDLLLIKSHYTLVPVDIDEDGVFDSIDQNVHGPIVEPN